MDSLADVALSFVLNPHKSGLGKLLPLRKGPAIEVSRVLIMIKIKGLTGLPKGDKKPRPGAKRSLPDPYVKVECEGHTAKTHVVWNSIDPVFNQTAIFYGKRRGCTIYFKVLMGLIW